jgi:hypothetical protein
VDLRRALGGAKEPDDMGLYRARCIMTFGGNAGASQDFLLSPPIVLDHRGTLVSHTCPRGRQTDKAGLIIKVSSKARQNTCGFKCSPTSIKTCASTFDRT